MECKQACAGLAVHGGGREMLSTAQSLAFRHPIIQRGSDAAQRPASFFPIIPTALVINFLIQQSHYLPVCFYGNQEYSKKPDDVMQRRRREPGPMKVIFLFLLLI